MSELVFVYGTLRPGGAAEEKMAGCEWLGGARVAGELYQIAWYPGLKLGGDDYVMGDLFRIPEGKMPALDAYEGCSSSDPQPHEYRRRMAEVTSANGLQRAWLWEYAWPLEKARLIPGGDWLEA